MGAQSFGIPLNPRATNPTVRPGKGGGEKGRNRAGIGLLTQVDRVHVLVVTKWDIRLDDQACVTKLVMPLILVRWKWPRSQVGSHVMLLNQHCIVPPKSADSATLHDYTLRAWERGYDGSVFTPATILT